MAMHFMLYSEIRQELQISLNWNEYIFKNSNILQLLKAQILDLVSTKICQKFFLIFSYLYLCFAFCRLEFFKFWIFHPGVIQFLKFSNRNFIQELVITNYTKNTFHADAAFSVDFTIIVRLLKKSKIIHLHSAISIRYMSFSLVWVF